MVPHERAVTAIFLFSGAAGLIYEVVWARQLVLVFGNTTQAIAAILTGFFAGLSIGSLVGGRIADRVGSPLRLYGVLEFVLVAVVLGTPLLFQALNDVYRSGFETLQRTPGGLAAVRFALALMGLAPATILMGATLPVLSRHLARRSDDLGSAFGRLYAVNTLGAIVGTLSAGLLLIELLGLSLTLAVGAACSGTAGVVAVALARRERRPDAPDVPVSAPHDNPAPVGHERQIALAAAFVSGLTSLGYQVLWTRLISSGTGSTTYVFTLILAFFLIGIAFGALVITSRPPDRRLVTSALGLGQVVIGSLAALGAVLVGGAALPLGFSDKVLLVVIPTTLAIGLALPLASRLVGTSDRHVGRDAGILLATNTLGVMCATILVPFVVVPAIGSPTSLLLLAWVNLGFGVLLLAAAARSRTAGPRHRVLATLGAALTAAVVIGAGLFRAYIADPALVAARDTGVVRAAAEDEIASVVAAEIGGRKQLLVAGTGMTALTVDAKLMAVLSAAIRPDADDALVIAFGMGTTYRSALGLGLRTVGVELVPSVPTMFAHYHPDAATVLADPDGELVIADGRNYLELVDRRFDLILVDPPPPIRTSGTAVLYSREFYEAAAARLVEGGLLMEWMPYDQTVDEFRAHVRTLRAVFPHALVAFGPGENGTFMFASKEPVTIEQDALRDVLERPGVVDDLAVSIDAPSDTVDGWLSLVPTLVWATDEGLDRFAAAGPLITDDRPLTEYFLLRSLTQAQSPPATRASLEAVRP